MPGRVVSLAAASVAGRCVVYVPAGEPCARLRLGIGSDALRETLHTLWGGLPLWKLPHLFDQSEANMVPSDTVGGELEDGQQLFDADLRRLELASSAFNRRNRSAGLTAQTLARLAQTIARGDRSLADQVLRCWGVR